MVHNATSDRALIVGAGHAAGELAGSLRQGGFAGGITMVGEEPHLPYQRPPLSKAFLSGEADIEAIQLKSRATYDKARIDVRLSMRVVGVDRAGKHVTLADGSRERYDKLILATGGRPRVLDIPGLQAPGSLTNLHYLRTIRDAERMRHQLKHGFSLVIVGGGYIGLEVAAVARRHGLRVTVLETLPRVLARVTAPELSLFYEEVHRGAGVDLRTGTMIRDVQIDESADAITAVSCMNGDVIPADLVVIGVGLIPNTEVAEQAGLAVDNGIVVDEFARTADPDIFAIGDCSNHPSSLYGRRIRLESVPNAVLQARTVAALLCGKPLPPAAVPWFWSDQYDLKLQIVGLSQGYDRLVVRGKFEDRSFIAFYLRDAHVVAADAVNRPKEFLLAKRLVADNISISSTDQLRDESLPLQDLLKSTIN